MTDEESLGLRTVAERFEESSDLLDRLRERVNALSLSEETERKAAESLDTSAAVLASLVTEIRGVVEQLGAAQATTQAALEVARTTLESTDLQVMREEIAALRTEFGEAQALRQRYDDLAARVARVPARARRKAGLEA